MVQSDTMSRNLKVGVAQLGPIAREDTRKEVVERLMDLLAQAADQGVELVVYPELAMTTFFPRWYIEDPEEMLSFFEEQMPSEETRPLFDEAARLGIGFCLGYAELHTDADGKTHRYNTQILVERDGVGGSQIPQGSSSRGMRRSRSGDLSNTWNGTTSSPARTALGCGGRSGG